MFASPLSFGRVCLPEAVPIRHDTGMSDPVLFGRYRVDRRIGSGAFATVWLAHDDLLDSPVAVKVLAENWTDRLDIRTRFSEEARILRRADSDHVVRVHDIGELPDGRPYFVMTYADAGTLADRLHGPLPEAEVVRLALGVADGLAVLHRLGVVHRDVKPSNVLFHGDRVLIADLGLARAIAHASGFTLAAGTPGYMAPEQAVMGGSVDSRADVYGLGALIMHMVSGKVPRLVSDERSAEFALEDVDSISGPLGDVVRKALSPKPADRYANAGDMAAALRRIRPAPPRSSVDSPRPMVTVPRPPTQIGEPTSFGRSRVFRSAGRRRRRVVAIAGAVVLAAAAGGGYAIWAANSTSSGYVTVSDKQISVNVPSDWSGQYRSGNWNLDQFGAEGEIGHGIEVAKDIKQWAQNGSSEPGVFIGESSQLNGRKAGDVLDAVNHPGCKKSTASGLPGTGLNWTGCAGDIAYTDTVIQKSGSVVYIQIKRPADFSDTKAILDSVKVSR
jgi:serine/threonine protein kinase